MSGNSTQDREDSRFWYWFTLVIGLASLGCYYFSVVFHVLPRQPSRMLFYAYGVTLALAAFAFVRLLRGLAGGKRPLFELGAISTVVAGVVVNLMAVIQDSNFTVMRRRILEAELESTKDELRRVLWGVNNVQISLDISFDIWIAAGVVFFALGCWLYLGARIFGILGALIGLMAIGVNFATLPHPPAEAGLFDPGPFVATWLGLMLAYVVYRYRREVL